MGQLEKAIIRQANRKAKKQNRVQTKPTAKYVPPEEREALAKKKKAKEEAKTMFGAGLHPKYGILKAGTYKLKKKKQ